MSDRGSQTASSADTFFTDPSAARMYDYYLGGAHNFEVDRTAAKKVIAAAPITPLVAQANRDWLRRVVTFIVRDLGIDQLIDLGSGIPTVNNVHTVAQDLNPDARIVYVDYDITAVTYAREILAGNPQVSVLHQDIRNLRKILGHPDTRQLINFDRRVAVLMVSVAHFIADVTDLLEPALDLTVDGSALAISHAALDIVSDTQAAAVTDAYRSTAGGVHLRGRSEIARLFTGFPLVKPAHTAEPPVVNPAHTAGSPRQKAGGGADELKVAAARLVPVDQWRPAPDHEFNPDLRGFLGGVGIRTRDRAVTMGGTR